MSSEEFEEWAIIDRHFDPFGEWRNDVRFGAAFAPLLNILEAVHLKSPKHWKVGDFVFEPKDWLPADQQEIESMDAQTLKSIFKGMHDNYHKRHKTAAPKKGKTNGRQ